jgi:predicted nucleotidyltransferase
MVLGYNQKRPKKEDYKDFLKKLVRGLESFNDNSVSLMLYGSYIRGDCVYGRSDIDAVLIFTDNMVIDKRKLSKLFFRFYFF